MKLFEIDTNTRMVELNKEWISTILEFKRILQRDKGSKNDISGRFKLQATKEFTFIYHFCDYRSKFINYSEKDKYKECLRNSELDSDLVLEKDDDLLKAVIKYKTLQTTPTLKLLSEVKETLHSSYNIIRKLRELIDAKLAKISLDDLVDKDKEKDKSNPITELNEYLNSVMNTGDRVTKSIKTIEELEEKVMKELGDDTSMRGKDTQKGIREDGMGTAKTIKRSNVMDDI